MPKVTMVGAGSAAFAGQNMRSSQVLADAEFDRSFRTATPVTNGANWW
jgi:histidine ammonia-lyase